MKVSNYLAQKTKMQMQWHFTRVSWNGRVVSSERGEQQTHYLGRRLTTKDGPQLAKAEDPSASRLRVA